MNSSSLKGKTLLVVNTGYAEKKINLQKLKKLGLTIVMLHREKNWAEPYVDHWIIAETANHTEAIQAVRTFVKTQHRIRIEGVMTFWEDDVLLTAKLVDRFNWIGIPYDIAKQVRNKFRFRAFCTEHGLPAPKHALLANEKDIDHVLASFTFPVVVKPAFGASSEFVVKAEKPKDFRDIVHYVQSSISAALTNGPAESEVSSLTDGLDILAEEYIDGDEVDIDILVQNGKIKFSSISDNFDKTRDIFFLDRGQAIPSALPEETQQELLIMAEEILERLGVQYGCIHMEAKATKKGPVPIEVNLRMGGDYVYSYTKDAWGVDLIEQSAAIALGVYIKPMTNLKPKKYMIGWDLHAEHSGILVELLIEDALKKHPHVEDMAIQKQIGDPILMPPQGHENLGWITVSGDNLLDAQDNLKDVLSLITYKVVAFAEESSIGKTSRKDRFSAAVLNKKLLIEAAKLEKVRRISLANQHGLHIGIIGSQSDAMGANVEKTLAERGYHVSFFDCSAIPTLFNELRKSDIDLVFNAYEQNDVTSPPADQIIALCEALRIPYTGSDALHLGLCRDKIAIKKLLDYHHIPTPQWDYIYDIHESISEELEYPLIVKPADTDNSFGITNESVVIHKQQLQKQLKKIIIDLGRPALIEEYIEGDEYSVSILGNTSDNIRVLPLSRSVFSHIPRGHWPIYTQHSRTIHRVNTKKITVQRPPKKMSAKLEAVITEIALDTYTYLRCQDYGRVELRVDKEGNPYVLELDPNPALYSKAAFPETAKLIGLDYGDLLEEIIRLAIHRYKQKKLLLH